MASQVYDPEQRAREKQASREADALAVASGAKSAAQLREENSLVRPEGARLDWAAWKPHFG